MTRTEVLQSRSFQFFNALPNDVKAAQADRWVIALATPWPGWLANSGLLNEADPLIIAEGNINLNATINGAPSGGIITQRSYWLEPA